jgi:hypothetical protein
MNKFSRLAKPEESASHYLPRFSSSLAEKSARRLAAMALFSEKDYHEMHPGAADGRDVGAFYHALCYGAPQGGPLFKPEQIARSLANASGSSIDEPLPSAPVVSSFHDRAEAFREQYPNATIYVSSLGNTFMKEIAGDLALDLRRAGMDVAVRDENSDIASMPPLSIVVAPHEFFTLGAGKEWMRDAVVSASFVYNTEQLHTPWFAKAMPAILASQGVFDISPQAARLFGEAGIPAMHLEPGATLQTRWLEDADMDHPLVDALPTNAKGQIFDPGAWIGRPIDVSFFGSESARRESFFGRNAATFAKLSSFIYYRRQWHGPILDYTEGRSLTRLAGHVAGYSKISLNIHRDEFPYFEWHRMVRQGMASGALVVTDPCLPHPHLRPGEHFFEEEARHIPNLLEWLIFDADGQRDAQRVLKNTADLLSSNEANLVRTDAILSFLSKQLGGTGP